MAPSTTLLVLSSLIPEPLRHRSLVLSEGTSDQIVVSRIYCIRDYFPLRIEKARNFGTYVPEMEIFWSEVPEISVPDFPDLRPFPRAPEFPDLEPGNQSQCFSAPLVRKFSACQVPENPHLSSADRVLLVEVPVASGKLCKRFSLPYLADRLQISLPLITESLLN